MRTQTGAGIRARVHPPGIVGWITALLGVLCIGVGPVSAQENTFENAYARAAELVARMTLQQKNRSASWHRHAISLPDRSWDSGIEDTSASNHEWPSGCRARGQRTTTSRYSSACANCTSSLLGSVACQAVRADGRSGDFGAWF